MTAAKPVFREFVDATGYAQSHSAIASSTPEGRLRAPADYLGLDGQWLARRCADLAAYGSAGLVQPRSRLLSVDSVDRACRFLARLHEASH